MLYITFVLACITFFMMMISCFVTWRIACFVLQQLLIFVKWVLKADTWWKARELATVVGIVAFELIMEVAHNTMILAIEACLM